MSDRQFNQTGINPAASDRFPLSVVVLARNEEINIGRCVRAVSWCDDVVVVDDRSTDRTASIAAESGARVADHQFSGFAAQRNWAMENCDLKNDWVLHLDADEVVTEALTDRLKSAVSAADPETAAFRMCRKTMLNNRWLKYSDGFPVWIMRLVRRGRAQFVDRGHGEVAVPDVSGELGTIDEPFLHFAFSKGLSDWIDRHNRYSTREALLEFSEGRDVEWRGLFSTDRARRRAVLRGISRRLWLRPQLRFCYQYFLKLGFLDGSAGFTFSRLMAVYESWIVLKRRELEAQAEDTGT